MSAFKTSIGGWKLDRKKAPRGNQGSVALTSENDGRSLEVQWIKDSHGIQLVLPDKICAFDIQTQWDDSERRSFQIEDRSSGAQWRDLSLAFGGHEAQKGVVKAAKGPLKIKSQMPGKILKILVEVGSVVEKGQALIVMEAMKMENEIRATRSGRVAELRVEPGQAVETGAELALLADLPEADEVGEKSEDALANELNKEPRA